MAIPKKGSTIEVTKLRWKHPEWSIQRNQLRWYRETVEGSGAYAPYTGDVLVADQWPTDESAGSLEIETDNRTHLYRHPRELAKFLRRYLMAYSPGVTKKSVRMYAGFLTKKQPIRDDYPEALTDWMDNVNDRSASWDVLLQTEIVPAVLMYGWLPVLVYQPPSEAQSAAEQQERGETTKVAILTPEALLDWRKNDSGGYDWLKWVEVVDLTEGPLELKKQVKRYWYATQEGWWYCDHDEKAKNQKKVEVKQSGVWPTGEMPLVVWKLGVNGESLIHHACELERELFNLLSELKELERESCFPMRYIQDPGEELRSTVAAVDGVIWVKSTDDEKPVIPGFVAPPPDPFDHYRTRIQEVTMQILQEFGLEFSEGSTTGIAQSFKMSKIVRMLVSTAGDLEEGEYLTHRLAGDMINAPLEDAARSAWPTEFDARDVEREVNALTEVVDLGVGPTFEAEARYRAAIAAMPNLSEKIKDDGRKEIQEFIDERGRFEAQQDEHGTMEIEADPDAQLETPQIGGVPEDQGAR